ncbi:uncharacterized protein CTRU02_204219 [Colletotrichum truncatum]|uniref:Uncharacterized protein n=1 Tax=Colletotrichum truncatum TaxID=5467 RepID=A0ACC3ZBI0_COLTU
MSTQNGSYSFTLKDTNASNWGEHPLAATSFGMKDAGFHRFGFVIYRTVYNDNAAWERYLEVLKLAARKSLDIVGGDVLLEQYMDWPVISDPALLNGASKADVRRHFKSWCAGRSEERDGPGATNSGVEWLPRFNYCLYVDSKCIDTLAKMPANSIKPQEYRVLSKPVIAVIDAAFDGRTPGSDRGLYPDVEGCTEWYVGWKYFKIGQLVSTYDVSHGFSLDEIDYVRPPLIAPDGYESMPN